MAIDLDIFSNDMDVVTNDLSHTLTWSGQSITVCKDDVLQNDDVQNEGIFQNRDVDVWATIADFTDSTLPAIYAVVSIDGVNYYIRDKEISAEKRVVKFSCTRV